MSLQPFFQWLNELPVSKGINESNWIYAVVQAFHLVALAVFAGAVLVIDLRLMGRGFIQQPLARVARDARPWVIGGFLGLVVTGIPQLMSGANKEYFSGLFWFKMEVLLVAIIFHLTAVRKVTQAEEGRVGPFWAKVVGLVSIVLWLGVAVLARLIGLF
jgi:cytochrome bd-type quinol oxidase subunit 2